MDRKEAREIERRFGKRIELALPVEYERQDVNAAQGRYSIPVPVYRVRFQGEHRFTKVLVQ